MTRPKISVVLCAYNCALVGKQLDSVLNQDEPPDELIVIDDSTDQGVTWEIIQNALRSTELKTVVQRHDANLGMRASYEEGLKLASCEIIATCDHDDVWMPEKLRVVRDAFIQLEAIAIVHDVVLFFGEHEPTTGNASRLSEETGWNRHQRFDRKLVPQLSLLRRNRFSGTAMAFRKEMLADLLPFPNSIFPDYWIALVASARGGLYWIDEPLVFYRRHGANTVELGPQMGDSLTDVFRPLLGIGAEGLCRLTEISKGSIRYFSSKSAYEEWRTAVRDRSNRLSNFKSMAKSPRSFLLYPSLRSIFGDCFRLIRRPRSFPNG